MRVLVTPTFERAVKKLHKQQKAALDEAVRTIVGQPEAGETKVGDLAGVQVYKFRMGNLLCLLAYATQPLSSKSAITKYSPARPISISALTRRWWCRTTAVSSIKP